MNPRTRQREGDKEAENEAATAEEFDGNAEDIEEEDFDDMDDGFLTSEDSFYGSRKEYFKHDIGSLMDGKLDTLVNEYGAEGSQCISMP